MQYVFQEKVAIQNDIIHKSYWPKGNILLLYLKVFPIMNFCTLIAGENFCTGSRIINSVESDGSGDVFTRIARGLFSRPPCARTFDPLEPGKIAATVKKDAEDCGAIGI